MSLSPFELPPAELAQAAVALAEKLLIRAQAGQTAAEKEQSERLARLMNDPLGKELTIGMVDQAFRSHQPARIADQISHLLDEYGTPQYMDWWERTALTVGGVMGHYLPAVVVPPIIARLRQETRTVILPGEEGDLRRYLQRRRAGGVRLNLNQLGEAILGEEEAARRMTAYLALLARPDVEYISVKVSSVFSQINLVAYRPTVELVKERLRTLYRQAMAHRYTRPDGHSTHKFINLDMEEYRDLHLTLDAFKEVLDETEFTPLSAGIVLQAYIPDSFYEQQRLTDWALARAGRGGAPIKIRIVKGANLAMERVEAAQHGWPQAPYTNKPEVDANFKRMVAYGCHPARARAVGMGVASHNLFDIAYALLLRQAAGVEEFVDFEMLEGMANHQARSVQTEAGGLLLYAPVVKTEDFHSAIAYLVRRLDENTAPENFLHDLFGMQPGSPEWHKQREQFLHACTLLESARSIPNRSQDRRNEQPQPQPIFRNEPDTDWSLPANQRWVAEIAAGWRDKRIEPIPLQIAGELLHTAATGEGIDPSRPDQISFRYSLATPELVERALATAVQAQKGWGSRPVAERKTILLAAGDELTRRRGDLIGAMLREAAKTPSEGDPEVSEGIDFARYYARSLDKLAEQPDVAFAPLGVVVVTPPWNFPFAIPAGGVLAALMAGNAVIFKPAPEAVLTGWQLAQALWAAGVPKNVLQFLPAPDNEIGRQLVVDERTAAVILTGSIETARLFQGWRPHLRLFAETSGKDSLIVTSLADRDQAIKDLVRSAFGHNGQKCSAASLAILEAEVYDDPDFRRQLRDAGASRAVGSAWELASLQTPLTQPPSPKLLRALTVLDAGEEWLLEPRPLVVADQEIGDLASHRLWSPGIKLGVQPGSFFHKTECFGPVLGLMRARDLSEAIDFANGVGFGLTGGIHSLDDREVEQWLERVEVGNAYINRHITGAIVRRQPFGGWKASVVGPGAKAGGPNYALQFGHLSQRGLPQKRARPAPPVASLLQRLELLVAPGQVETLRAGAGSYAWAWAEHFSQEHDPSRILGERNVLRYRPLRGLLLRADRQTPPPALALALLAAATVRAAVHLSIGPGMEAWHWLERAEGVTLVEEGESNLVSLLQIAPPPVDRLRALAPLETELRRALNNGGISVIEGPLLANGRLELGHYLREQAVSQTVHRYGNVLAKYR
ncbi:MAG: proline dehydrogenase family protein [Caldilineaceae bacterium]|nr:proline dehydrogenase family protein [Caldilineaceae bacterium]